MQLIPKVNEFIEGMRNFSDTLTKLEEALGPTLLMLVSVLEHFSDKKIQVGH